MHWLTDIRLPAEASGVRDARRVVDVIAPAVTAEQCDDLRLLVSEVATNAIRHGRPVEPDVEPVIRVRLGVERCRLRVEVHDRGPGFHARPRGPRARLDSGWGVHFVHTLADTWGSGYDESGTWVVWFEFLLAPSGEDDAMTYGQRAVEGGPADPASEGRPARLGQLVHARGHGDQLARTG
ncbi:transcriptional regulator [Paraconexibacter sp. AEG42_29]|uniref:Transcriptional regulator n=1 Tax=Paraconexibacter sp. AEG42_29 TaxID=2997339 RepID=A0AAU7AXM0_9ACTN